MRYAILINGENRVLSATYEEFAPIGSIIIDSIPEGNITDYLYKDNEFHYSPLDATLKTANKEIKELKAKLAATDYQAIKYAEGWIEVDEYLPIKLQRQNWRERINELEAVIASL